MSASLYHPNYDDLRALMRAVRVKAGLTQVQMADALGVGQSYVSKLERGENFVDVLLYARWCQACGTKPGAALDELLSIARLEDSSPQ
ncbi:helix-turn-helix domain-containing protein [Delftia acidovorans]|uniref:helix-turn-helix domain-containing protein n=1 Tax=Delftia acidovorans TaxID=80866 RepID=UPI00286F4E8D|nr:helix-turn-helix transcriptional regulator [Delftia acidovorans]